jgi:hypothetical protein
MEQVPKAKRPDLPNKATTYTRQAIADAGWLPSSDSDARGEINSLRRYIQISDINSDRAVTARTLADEIATITIKPDDQITQLDMARIALIDQIAGSKRPDLPGKATPYARQQIADSGWLPTNDADALAEINSLRAWAAANSDAGLQALAERVGRGEQISSNVLASVAARPGMLDKLGLSSDDLLRSSLESLRARGVEGSNDVLEDLRLARSVARGMDIDAPSQRLVRDKLVEALDRNVDRVEGRRHDGYSNWVDFADVGSSVSSGELLLRMRAPAAPIADATAGATTVAADAVDDAAEAGTIIW